MTTVFIGMRVQVKLANGVIRRGKVVTRTPDGALYCVVMDHIRQAEWFRADELKPVTRRK